MHRGDRAVGEPQRESRDVPLQVSTKIGEPVVGVEISFR